MMQQRKRPAGLGRGSREVFGRLIGAVSIPGALSQQDTVLESPRPRHVCVTTLAMRQTGIAGPTSLGDSRNGYGRARRATQLITTRLATAVGQVVIR